MMHYAVIQAREGKDVKYKFIEALPVGTTQQEAIDHFGKTYLHPITQRERDEGIGYDSPEGWFSPFTVETNRFLHCEYQFWEIDDTKRFALGSVIHYTTRRREVEGHPGKGFSFTRGVPNAPACPQVRVLLEKSCRLPPT